jgi:hypothetical protein
MTDYKIVLEPEKMIAMGQRTELTPDQMAYLALATTITALPDEIKVPILECQGKMLALIKEYGDAGLMALALVGMKLQAELGQ